MDLNEVIDWSRRDQGHWIYFVLKKTRIEIFIESIGKIYIRWFPSDFV